MRLACQAGEVDCLPSSGKLQPRVAFGEEMRYYARGALASVSPIVPLWPPRSATLRPGRSQCCTRGCFPQGLTHCCGTAGRGVGRRLRRGCVYSRSRRAPPTEPDAARSARRGCGKGLREARPLPLRETLGMEKGLLFLEPLFFVCGVNGQTALRRDAHLVASHAGGLEERAGWQAAGVGVLLIKERQELVGGGFDVGGRLAADYQ